MERGRGNGQHEMLWEVGLHALWQPAKQECPLATCKNTRKTLQITDHTLTLRTSASNRGMCKRVSTCPSKEIAQSQARENQSGSGLR